MNCISHDEYTLCTGHDFFSYASPHLLGLRLRDSDTLELEPRKTMPRGSLEPADSFRIRYAQAAL